MNEIVIVFLYFFLLIVLIIVEIILLQNDKGKYLITSYKALENIFGEDDDSYKYMCNGNSFRLTTSDKTVPDKTLLINRFYEEYAQEDSRIKKFFPNVVIWLDAIIFRIDCGHKKTRRLKDNIKELKEIRDKLECMYPFNKCEKYQQDILHDIQKLETNENKIIISNIVKRTEDEFIRLSRDINKNNKANRISIIIGIIGIVVSICMAFVKFNIFI